MALIIWPKADIESIYVLLENYPARKCRLVHVSFCGSATEHSVEEFPYLFRDFDPEWGSGRLAAVQLPELEDYRQFFVVWDHADEIDDANGCGFYNSAGPQAWATLAPSVYVFPTDARGNLVRPGLCASLDFDHFLPSESASSEVARVVPKVYLTEADLTQLPPSCRIYHCTLEFSPSGEFRTQIKELSPTQRQCA